MNNNIDKYYLIYDTCMKLKKLGFNMWCEKIYTPYPHYKGEPLGCDEEYELRAEGKGNEIEYKIITEDFVNKNSDRYGNKSCSCPEVNDVVDWILENYGVHILVKPYYGSDDKVLWFCDIHYIKENMIVYMHTITNCEHKYKAYADGIRWVLDNCCIKS